jgi:phosphotransferase system  glucose/maltose/N-acetylglucosamine-specific IIC component
MLPVFLALLVAWGFWRKRQVIIGNAVGAGILFMSAVLFAGADYVEFLRYRLGCQAAHLGCPLSHPSDFIKLSAYAVVGFVHVMALFLLSSMIEDRIERRDHDASWRGRA